MFALIVSGGRSNTPFVVPLLILADTASVCHRIRNDLGFLFELRLHLYEQAAHAKRPSIGDENWVTPWFSSDWLEVNLVLFWFNLFKSCCRLWHCSLLTIYWVTFVSFFGNLILHAVERILLEVRPHWSQRLRALFSTPIFGCINDRFIFLNQKLRQGRCKNSKLLLMRLVWLARRWSKVQVDLGHVFGLVFTVRYAITRVW